MSNIIPVPGSVVKTFVKSTNCPYQRNSYEPFGGKVYLRCNAADALHLIGKEVLFSDDCEEWTGPRKLSSIDSATLFLFVDNIGHGWKFINLKTNYCSNCRVEEKLPGRWPWVNVYRKQNGSVYSVGSFNTKSAGVANKEHFKTEKTDVYCHTIQLAPPQEKEDSRLSDDHDLKITVEEYKLVWWTWTNVYKSLITNRTFTHGAYESRDEAIQSIHEDDNAVYSHTIYLKPQEEEDSRFFDGYEAGLADRSL